MSAAWSVEQAEQAEQAEQVEQVEQAHAGPTAEVVVSVVELVLPGCIPILILCWMSWEHEVNKEEHKFWRVQHWPQAALSSIYIYIYIYMCIYIYMYILIYNTCIYIYIYTYRIHWFN